MSSNSDSSTGLGLGRFVDDAQSNAKRVRFVMGGLASVPLAIGSLLFIAANVLAGWSMPLLRVRMGGVFALGYGLAGLLTLSSAAGLFFRGPAAALLAVWVIALAAALFAHAGAIIARPFRKGGSRVHRASIGEPSPWMVRLFAPLLRSHADKPIAYALLAEPLLLVCFAAVVFALESVSGRGPSGAYLLPVLAAAGTFYQGLFILARDRAHVALIADQETEQTQLAEQLARRTAARSAREIEGVGHVGEFSG